MRNQNGYPETRITGLNREKRIKIYFFIFILGFGIIFALNGQYSFLIALGVTVLLSVITGILRSFLSSNNGEVRFLEFVQKPIGLAAFVLLIFTVVLIILNKCL